MPEHFLIPSLVTDLLAPCLAERAGQSNVSVSPTFGSALEAMIESKSGATFILATARLETLVAASSEMKLDDLVTRATDFAEAAKALCQKYRDRLFLIDLEDASEFGRERFRELAEENGWPPEIEDWYGEITLPHSLRRLVWAERKITMPRALLLQFSDLDAHVIDVSGGEPTSPHAGEKTSSRHRFNLSLKVIREHEQLLSDLKESQQSAHQHAATLAEMQEELMSAQSEAAAMASQVQELESQLEQSQQSENISDLMITLLQQELESSLQPSEASAEQPAVNTGGTASETTSESAPEAPSVRYRPPNAIFRMAWAVKLLSEPRTRANQKIIRASGLFDAAWYATTYPDISASKMPPIVHYLKHGAAEGRDPSPQFSTRAYLWKHPHLDPNKENPLVHSIQEASRSS